MDPKAIDRRNIRLTGECLAEKLGIKGVITSIRFDPQTNCLDIFFLGYGGMIVPEGMESLRMTAERWAEIDDSHQDQEEEELINQWESD